MVYIFTAMIILVLMFPIVLFDINNQPNTTISICGPVYKLMEQWMPKNDYKCHEV